MKPVKKPQSSGAKRALQDDPHGRRTAHHVDPALFRCALLAWYDANGRDLPWRRTTDPYRILVSEVMLQQTQVSRVEEYWRRFMDRFPTIEALAAASEDDVCSVWSGLGYYRRARNLRSAARRVVDGAAGFPPTAAALRELPGIGAYTAAAVASIAFDEAVPVLDANVVRVLARITAEPEDVSRASVRRRLAAVAVELLEPVRPGDFNQAMMELGALVCSPTSPGCARCAVAAHCCAFASGAPERLPVTRAVGRTNVTHETAALVVRHGRVLLTNAPDARGWWPGLWRLPRVSAGEAALRGLLEQEFGLTCDALAHVATAAYGVTTNRVTLEVMACRSPRGRLRRSPHVRWFALEEALSLGVPAADRRVLERHGPDLVAP